MLRYTELTQKLTQYINKIYFYTEYNIKYKNKYKLRDFSIYYNLCSIIIKELDNNHDEFRYNNREYCEIFDSILFFGSQSIDIFDRKQLRTKDIMAQSINDMLVRKKIIIT